MTCNGRPASVVRGARAKRTVWLTFGLAGLLNLADRLDITGSRWSVPGAEAVLTLRALISNGDFPEYWIFHTQKQRERLSPRPDQHNYELLD